MAAFAATATRFLEAINALAPRQGNALHQALLAHLDVADVSSLDAHAHVVSPAEQVNLQRALDHYFEHRQHELIGLPPELGHHMGASLSALLNHPERYPLQRSSLSFVERPVAPRRTLPCLRSGLFLFAVDDQPVVALLRLEEAHQPKIVVEAMSGDGSAAAAFLADIERLRHELNAFRGQILSFEFTQWGDFGITFHPLPAIARDDVILPEDDLASIERHAVAPSRHADGLRAAGHQLKRGLLLYGPPGTGKTFTILYLCNAMAGRTTVLLAGAAEHLLGQAVALARSLQPATVVLEDVDLIALERGMHPGGSNPLLFQLLNEMDGLEDDADVLFVLTTNRVELLEPALAQRPGRVDVAVEIALPDDAARLRLLERYFRDTPGSSSLDFAPLVARTAGQPAAFIKELARRSWLEALDEGAAEVSLDHVVVAAEELERRRPPVSGVPVDEVTGTAPVGGWEQSPGW